MMRNRRKIAFISKNYKAVFWFVTIIFVSSSCILFPQEIKSTSEPTVGHSNTPTAIELTPTLTRVFETITPLPDTQTPEPSVTPLPPTITTTQILPGIRYPETPVPVQRSAVYPQNQVKILLLGADLRESGPYHTDSILVLILNPVNNSVRLLSLPPALYVNIPDVGMERINNAINYGGPGKVMDTLQYNLGFRPDKYLLLDLNNFSEIIGFLDTISVFAATPMTGRCDIPQSVDGWCSVAAGWNQMDNNMALWYVRSTEGGETKRLLRSHEVLIAVFSRLMDIQAISRVEELYSTFRDNVETDLSIYDLNALVPLSQIIQNPDHLRRYTLTTSEAVPFTLPDGEVVNLLNQNAAWEIIRLAVFES
jgi:anionic cell wall polymer biosynthesis LytR-Cps2A-Psr (LCP) family protein